MVTYDGRFANHHTRTMVDSEIFANLCTGMNVNTSLGVCLFGDDTWNDGDVQLMQFMGYAVVRHGVYHGVTEDHLTIVACSGVIVEHGLHIGVQQTFDFRQGVDELQSQTFRLLIYQTLSAGGLTVLTKLQAMGHLLDK